MEKYKDGLEGNLKEDKNMKYRGKVALLFGGTSNIGRAIALDLAGFGAAVAIHYMDSEEVAKKLVTKCNSLYKEMDLDQEAFMVRADAKDKKQIKQAIEAVIEKYRRLDFLINIFTYPFRQEVWNEVDPELTDIGYQEAFLIDVMGTKHAMDYAIPHMKKSRGSIVNFCSSPVISGYSEGTAYSAAKSAVKQLTMDYSQKYGPDGVRINCVAPGWVPKGNETKEELEEARLKTPLRQLGSPEYISQVVSDILDWKHVTGQTFVVDGGETMR